RAGVRMIRLSPDGVTNPRTPASQDDKNFFDITCRTEPTNDGIESVRSTMGTILKAENLEKVYRVGKVDVPALRGVSLEVEEGEFLSVMGPSGCGKSTMLHLFGGLLTPTKGRIVVAGEDLTAASDAKRTDIRRR